MTCANRIGMVRTSARFFEQGPYGQRHEMLHRGTVHPDQPRAAFHLATVGGIDVEAAVRQDLKPRLFQHPVSRIDDAHQLVLTDQLKRRQRIDQRWQRPRQPACGAPVTAVPSPAAPPRSFAPCHDFAPGI